jgi:succinyl-CoA synthetase alpha subunit
MIEYGTNVVGGGTQEGGSTHLDLPVFNTVRCSRTSRCWHNDHFTTSFAADAMEAADAGIKVIIAITEGFQLLTWSKQMLT